MLLALVRTGSFQAPRSGPRRIGYLDGHRLRRSLVAACDYTESKRRELNRINVFPVPDGDTGTNLALTVRAVADHLRRMRDPSVSVVAREAAEAAVLGARGNSGMMLSHFLLGFAGSVGERARMGTADFSRALEAGAGSLYAAIERPVEGTILTVIRETAEAARETDLPDFRPYLETLLDRARSSLERTPELLPMLKKAGVVDAGAKGFVHILEGAVSITCRGNLQMGRAPDPAGAQDPAEGPDPSGPSTFSIPAPPPSCRGSSSSRRPSSRKRGWLPWTFCRASPDCASARGSSSPSTPSSGSSPPAGWGR